MSLRRRWLQFLVAIRKRPPAALAPPDTFDPAMIAAMLREIGIALVEVAQPTPIVESRLMRIAAQYSTEPVRVAVLPTMLIVQVGEAAQIDGSTYSSLQLDAAGRIDDIAGLAEAGAISPTEAVTAIAEARHLRPRFGPVATTVGYAITTLGFGIIINPAWGSLPAYIFLGLVVGTIVQLRGPFPALVPILPTLSALVVTLLATWFVADTANEGLLNIISPSLVAILPGMALTTGAMELASSQIISGASRLVYGLAQLALLVFGVVMGVHIAGQANPQMPSVEMGSWSLYVAIVIVAFGLWVYLSAPAGSLLWLMVAIAVALIGQQLAEHFTGASHSGFIGAMLSVPFAMLAARIRTSPPAIVMLLVTFYSLVPGALSFMSLGEAATGGNPDSGSLEAAGTAILSIALGTLVGWSVFGTISSRLPWPTGRAQPTVR